ncbi:replication factor C small subunit [Candidatus Woesearchaeota archaeon]|nr:replication factor C small subunit [Candidatus Woesearchaeota archaeon]
MESTLWTEKYRPKDFSDIKGQAEVVKRVKAFVEKKNMPHLLFTGPAGTGKTSLSIVIAKTLFGEAWRQNLLELNASDERGIDVIRNKVKDFARTRPIGDMPFKIIYLDECDALTREAQQALRRTMENYTGTTRFILSANYASKIIEPIQSRCAVFRFRHLDKKDVFDIINKIAAHEGLHVTEAAHEALFEVSEGDLRKLENILQSSASITNKVDDTTIYAVASTAKPKDIVEILMKALKNDFLGAKQKLFDTMMVHGLSGVDIIKHIQREILNLPVDIRMKMHLIEKCGEIEFRMSEGADEFIQLEALLSQFALAGGA